MKQNSIVALLGALVVSSGSVGCSSTVFHAKNPTSSDVSIVISNEPLERGSYEVMGIVVAERTNYFLDAWGFVNSRENALGEVITDDIEEELFARARKLRANALVDVRVINYRYHAGCGADAPWIPFGYAEMAVQATAIRLRDEPAAVAPTVEPATTNEAEDAS